jgi:imidazolonepropionase-like amidohydrolase
MIIRNGNLHVGDGRLLPQTDLRILNGKIAELGQRLCADGEEELDAAGREIFPGFLDPCCGIGCMGLPTRYADNNEVSDPLLPEMNLKYSVDPDELSNQEFYKSGITTVGLTAGNAAVCGGRTVVVKTPAMRFDRRIVRENAVLKCSVTSAVKEQFGEKNVLPMTKMGIFYLLNKAFDGAQRKKPEERNEKERVFAEALEGKLPLCIAAETQSEIQAVLHLAEQWNLSVTIADGYEFHRCMEEMLKSRAGLVLGNLSALSQKTKHCMELPQLNRLIENGNRIAFSTSCGGYSEGREVLLWTAIDVCNAGVDPEQVVRMLTDHPAHLLGAADRIGTLEPGKDADLSVWTAHPLKTYQAHVETCFVDGRTVYHE